jgi:hypothetical protein
MSHPSSRRLVAAIAFALGLVTLGGRPASAKLLELTLKVHGGGIAGLYGTENYDPLSSNPDLAAVTGKDFFKERRGATFGGTFGVEVLFVDIIYEFYQFVDGKGLGSTLNNFLIGFDWDFNVGTGWAITPYLVTGFGLATQNNSWLKKQYPEYPQITGADLTSKIVMVRIGVQFERKLGRFFRLGLDLGAGYHYAMETAKATNDLSGHSHGFHILGNLYLAFVWNVFGHKEKPHMAPDTSQTPPATGAPPGTTPPGAVPPPKTTPPATTPPATTPPATPPATTPPVTEPPPAAPPRDANPPDSTPPPR